MVDKKSLKTPTGMAGLVRYEEGSESKIKLTPKLVIAITVGMIILEILLIFLKI